MMATVSIFIFNLRQDFHQIHTLVVFVSKKDFCPNLQEKINHIITSQSIQ